MEFTELNQARHSVRDFADRPVDPQLLRQIVIEAQQAPSWVNSQPWKVYIATGKHLEEIKQVFVEKDAVKEKSSSELATMPRSDWGGDAPAHMKEWGHDIVNHFDNYDQAHQTMTGLMEHLNHTPAIAYVTIPTSSPEWAIFDAGSFAQTLMLAAKDKGVDSIPTYNSVRFPRPIKRILGIPSSEKLVIGIELGYASDAKVNSFRAPRIAVDEMLTILD